jgi:ABC-type Zn uptake system ZnuABC Zn-binding protein ZnuA
MKTITALTFCLLSLTLFPASAGMLACSHPELCKLAAVLADENHLRDLETKSLINMTGDPHEYEPSTAEIKALMSAPVLIIGPSELNPWIKKIHFQRSKNPALKTISLPFEKKMLDSYPKALAETLSHFWLYPKIYCAFKHQLTAELKKNGENVTEKNCDSEKVEKELRTALLKIKKPLILTHDALLPLLASLAPGEQIVAIKGSGHHQEAGIDAIKKMYQALEAPSVIWIVESGINVPQNILNKIRPTDFIIKIDTANSSNTKTFSVLTELAQKLTLAGEKK